MTLNLESFMKIGQKVLVCMVLDYKDKFDATLTNINKELVDLRNIFTKLEPDLAIIKNTKNKYLATLLRIRENVGLTKSIPERNF